MFFPFSFVLFCSFSFGGTGRRGRGGPTMAAWQFVGCCGLRRTGIGLGKKLCKIILLSAMALRAACSRII